MSDIQVITVSEPPAIGKPQMIQGIRDEAAARNWARRNGYEKVWWYKNRQRVYADKTQKVQQVLL